MEQRNVGLEAGGAKVWLAKLLELIGMVVVLSGFLFGVKYGVMRFELNALGIGGAIFAAGWLLERK